MYEVVLLSKKWGNIVERWQYKRTPEGLKKAREKRVELMVKHLDNQVEIWEFDDTKAG